MIDWNQILVGSVTCLCCLAVFGMMYLSLQRRTRSPQTRQVGCIAKWGLLVTTIVAMFAIEGAIPDSGTLIAGMWIVLLAIGVTTGKVIASIHWTGITQDRQHWESAANELRESKHRFELARKATSGGWWEWRIPENELWGDREFLELLSGSEPCPQHDTCLRWERILHADDVAKVYRELTRHLELASEIVIDCRVRAAADKYRWCRIKAVSIQQPDNTSFVLAGSMQDIDDFRRTEEHLRQLSEYISHKHKLESLGEVTGSVAHEFKNVLQAISGQLQFAERHIPEESKARNELAMATTLIEQANEISEGLLRFTGRSNESAKLVHPNTLLKTLEIVLRPMLPDNIELSIAPMRHPVRIAAVPTALQQALLNLCLNARDAMPGGGKLTVSAQLVGRRCRKQADAGASKRFVRFSVKDTGAGVPAEIRSRIFEPFFSTKAAGEGTGLGLAIVADIAKKHRGRVTLKVENHCGSLFSLLVPVATRSQHSRDVCHRPPTSFASIHTKPSAS